PTLFARKPLAGRMMALATRYVVTPQDASSSLTPIPPAMYGSTTFAMVVSSTSMKLAKATRTAISQGLAAARDAAETGVAAAPTPPFPDPGWAMGGDRCGRG